MGDIREEKEFNAIKNIIEILLLSVEEKRCYRIGG